MEGRVIARPRPYLNPMKTHIRANWSHAVLVCKKCQKRNKPGFGPEQASLAKALKRRMAGGKGRKARTGILEVPCVDICPKKGVVMIDSRAPGDWRIITEEVDIDALAQQLSA